jgi:hypothetical protein
VTTTLSGGVERTTAMGSISRRPVLAQRSSNGRARRQGGGERRCGDRSGNQGSLPHPVHGVCPVCRVEVVNAVSVV